MLKLIIIDDEEPIRYLIKNLIPYEELGITVIGEADDGKAGMAMCRELLPDIVFTDIRMPEMDGFTLLENVKKENITTKVILISGYDDFSYAQKALNTGAFDYILKPLKEADLVDMLERVIKEISREKKKEN